MDPSDPIMTDDYEDNDNKLATWKLFIAIAEQEKGQVRKPACTDRSQNNGSPGEGVTGRGHAEPSGELRMSMPRSGRQLCR